MAEVCRHLEISDVTYYRWRKEYEGLNVNQARHLKEIEAENTRLRKVISDLTIDNAEVMREWLHRLGIDTLFIARGSPWENGYIESFNGKLRYELLGGEIFDTLLEAKVIIERWRRDYNTIRPHSSLGFKPPAPEAYQPLQLANA